MQNKLRMFTVGHPFESTGFPSKLVNNVELMHMVD